MSEQRACESPPPNYYSLNFALRVPVNRRGGSSRVRRLQITLVVGNWIGIIAFIISSVVICVPVLSDDLSYPLKTTIRVLGYILMGVVAVGMLFLNCVIRRTIIQELIRMDERRRRRVSSIATDRELPPYPSGFLPVAEGQPGAYLGPCSSPKDGPFGLPDYETAIAQGPPLYEVNAPVEQHTNRATESEVPSTSVATVNTSTTQTQSENNGNIPVIAVNTIFNRPSDTG